MASELLSTLLWASATLSVGILIVLALRIPVRRLAGARVAYLLWLIPPLGFGAWLAPARQVTISLPATTNDFEAAAAATTSDLPALLLIACWLAGLAALIAVFRLQQRRFQQSAGALEPVSALGRNVFAGAPTHGPAVVGALRPIILLPNDFNSRFSADEQALILAHERAHVERGDPLVNAAAMAVRAVHWFNPLVHVAAQVLRTDQELACDAAVIARHSGTERTYAQAMLKSHAEAFEVPVGCAWHTAAFHPLKERILMLKASPSRLSRHLGLSFVAAAAFAVSGTVWLMRPVEVLAAPTEVDEEILSGTGAEDIRQAVIDAQQAMEDAHAAMAEARQTARVDARQIGVEIRQAMKEARAAIAEARRSAAVDARQAVIEAREAMLAERPALAEAERAIREAEPEIAAAQAEAAMAVDEAMHEVHAAMAQARHAHRARATAGQKSTCRQARAMSRQAKLLEQNICIAPSMSTPDAPPED